MNCNYKKTLDTVSYDSFQAAIAATDLCYLTVLHDEFGFGRERLKKILDLVQDCYIDTRNRYCVDEDVRHITPKSAHIVALESNLKDGVGLDYEDEIRRAEQEHKGRWHGNPVLEGKKK